MRSDYVDSYTEIYQKHWWWRAREQYIRRALGRVAASEQATSHRKILDVGCGDGLVIPMLREFGSVHGVEPNPPAHSTRMRDDITYCQIAEFRSTESLDWICLFDVLEHLDNRVSILQTLRGQLRANGKLIVTVPAFQWLWTAHDELNEHRIRYSRETLEAEFRAAGFQTMEVRYFFHWLVLPKILTRFLEQFVGARPAPPKIPPRLINSFLIGLSILEQKTADPLSIPIGSSLYGVFTSLE